ncbi:cyclic di-GMP phosphodiesterase [Trinickia terrae]|uniref:Cyclic di-GMP phosphodiesterase n=1 Tax=Trinickia terrae TaxID=2571161 RepID=A0A4U1IFG3_9BURK|nr:cyclic di-GMP phosphodiesterase [Trinickia terrae]TKC92474.1 cyclic di-GMP phosphodiesterase [Trinickia terrae]
MTFSLINSQYTDKTRQTSSQDDQLTLYTLFGTTRPRWRLTSDSNTLELAAFADAPAAPAAAAVALPREEAQRIRRLTGVTAHLAVDVSFYGKPLRLDLVGKKLSPAEWAGTAAPYDDSRAVARDRTHRLPFAEQVLAEVNSVVVILDRRGIIQRFNRLAEETTGMKEEDVVGKSAQALFISGDGASSGNIDSFFRHGKSSEVERYVKTLKGPRLYRFRNKFVKSGGGLDEVFLICSGADITDERSAQARLTELATTDALTGLPNRHAIHEKIRAAIDEAGDGQTGILFLDLDNFKKVNDHYGHAFGDQLLRDVSSAVKGCLAPGDTLARLGGDEFIVLSPAATLPALEATAQRIQERLCVPFDIGAVEVHTGSSIGIALAPRHGDSVESVIRSADVAMYVAKDSGKRAYRVFSPDMDKRVADYVWLNTNLRKGLEEKELVLHYQPRLCTRTSAVVGAEALLRWNSPERGQIAPAEFIPYAEESGLIAPLGRWVMDNAAEQAARWQAQGLDLRIAVNVSPRQLVDTAITAHFEEALRKARLARCTLDIELTESCLIENEAAAISLIKEFRKLGAEVHLDDFGSGYSSLSQLARIPFDAIKLDRSFITAIDVNPRSQVVVRSMVAVAQELNVEVLAEGVETPAEEDFLKAAGVDCVQGYLYGKPMPAAEFEAWLAGRRRLRLIA